MKEKLEQLPDYCSKLSTDPVALLKTIKLQMHDTVRAQYSEWTRITAMEKLITFCQQDLSLVDHTTHFKELCNMFDTQNGTRFTNSTLLHKLRVSLIWHSLDGKSGRRKPTTVGSPFYLISMWICIGMGALLVTFRHLLLTTAMNTHTLWKRLSIFWIVESWIQASSHRQPHLIRVQPNNTSLSWRLQTKTRRNLRPAALRVKHQFSSVTVMVHPIMRLHIVLWKL